MSYSKNYLAIGTIIFILLIGWFFYNFFQKNIPHTDIINFSYPVGDIEFAGEKIPDFQKNFLIKERFDKEFLNISYNLYQFFLYVKRLPIYMPYIEQQLEIYNIPDDFKYLAIAESALRNDVISPAGAGGIWQFMPATGAEYGLIINDLVDERYNFEKSTIAAMEYLSYLHTLFDDWTLVAASYNRGQNAIKNALQDQGVESYYDLYLNEETSRYVFRILAIKYVLRDYEHKKHTIDGMIGGQYSLPLTQKISVGKIENLKTWAKEHGYNYQVIKNLNQWILSDTLPEGNWEISVPIK